MEFDLFSLVYSKMFWLFGICWRHLLVTELQSSIHLYKQELTIEFDTIDQKWDVITVQEQTGNLTFLEKSTKKSDNATANSRGR